MQANANATEPIAIDTFCEAEDCAGGFWAF